jgi:hypothetical protein
MADRERAVWAGQVVTVISRGLRTTEIRDQFGFVHEVRKREVSKLRDDDERGSFRAPEVKD